jgi:hypothetical protein
MANKWIKHLQQFRQKNKSMDARSLMKEARKSYQNGGGDVTPYTQSNLASTASELKQQGGRRSLTQKRRSSQRSSRRRSTKTRRR